MSEQNYENIAMMRHIFDALGSNNTETSNEQTEDDKLFREKTTSEISERDKEYTYLLQHFVKITKIRNYLKEIFKWIFYLIIMISLFFFFIMLYKLFNSFIKKANIEQLINSIPLFITSIVSFISVIIAIPIAITKYLFSTKEDENITNIILHTQRHDSSGRQWALDFNKSINNTITDSVDNIRTTQNTTVFNQRNQEEQEN